MTHICVGKLTIIDSDNGLSPGRCQAIIWTNAGILLIGPLRTNFNEILIGLICIQIFSFEKMHLKMSSAKWRPFCFGLNVLKESQEVERCQMCKYGFIIAKFIYGLYCIEAVYQNRTCPMSLNEWRITLCRDKMKNYNFESRTKHSFCVATLLTLTMYMKMFRWGQSTRGGYVPSCKNACHAIFIILIILFVTLEPIFVFRICNKENHDIIVNQFYGTECTFWTNVFLMQRDPF